MFNFDTPEHFQFFGSPEQFVKREEEEKGIQRPPKMFKGNWRNESVEWIFRASKKRGGRRSKRVKKEHRETHIGKKTMELQLSPPLLRYKKRTSNKCIEKKRFFRNRKKNWVWLVFFVRIEKTHLSFFVWLLFKCFLVGARKIPHFQGHFWMKEKGFSSPIHAISVRICTSWIRM